MERLKADLVDAWNAFGGTVATPETLDTLPLMANGPLAEQITTLQARLQVVEANIRREGTKARDAVLERLAGDGSVDNDLADTLSSIVDACARAALAPQKAPPMTDHTEHDRAIREAAEWRDIGTAPKDEMLLLAKEFDGPGDWRIKIGYFFSAENQWKIFGASWRPSHWAPLPAPPSAIRQEPRT